MGSLGSDALVAGIGTASDTSSVGNVFGSRTFVFFLCSQDAMLPAPRKTPPATAAAAVHVALLKLLSWEELNTGGSILTDENAFLTGAT
jgi:hypothetical protein